MNLYLVVITLRHQYKNKFTKGRCGSWITQDATTTKHVSKDQLSQTIWSQGQMTPGLQWMANYKRTVMCKGHRRSETGAKGTAILNTASSTSRGKATDRRTLVKQWIWTGVSSEQNYSCSQWSEATSKQLGNDHGDNHVPFTNVSGIGLKIHWWLLPVGGWEKQQPAGRKWGAFQICFWPHPFETPEWVPWKQGIFWENFSVHLNITRKQHSLKGDNPRNYIPKRGGLASGWQNQHALVRYFGKM